MQKISLILGGARSGKSKYAEDLAAPHINKIYIATAQACRTNGASNDDSNDDSEMQSRIKTHQSRRGPDWQTIEEPLDLKRHIQNQYPDESVILIDCMTLWLSNLMENNKNITIETENLLSALNTTTAHIILVTNELGHSIVPENALARAFRDEQGLLNQKLAKAATNVVFITAGLPMILKEA